MTRPAHLFLSCDGDLYDTRATDANGKTNWSTNPPLRRRYAFTGPAIRTTHELKAALRAGATTDLGGYPLYFVTREGEALSFAAVGANLRDALAATRGGWCSQWNICGVEINWEDTQLECAHSNEPIPSAYGAE